jgi:pteridine reductase
MTTERPVALVTGGARRVGRAIVERLAAEGFAVAFTYLDSQRGADVLAQKIDGYAIRADLSDPENSTEHIRSAFATFADHLNMLVNSASAYLAARLGDTDMKLMRTVAAIHVQSPLLLVQKFEKLLRQSRGHVVNMCDFLGERPWPKYLAYSASKAALANLTLGLARELAPDVTVNGIAPGVVAWPEGFPEDKKQKYLKRVPLARAGTPQDVAELVHFLATKGSYITGQIIRLDGGRSIT